MKFPCYQENSLQCPIAGKSNLAEIQNQCPVAFPGRNQYAPLEVRRSGVIYLFAYGDSQDVTMSFSRQIDRLARQTRPRRTCSATGKDNAAVFTGRDAYDLLEPPAEVCLG